MPYEYPKNMGKKRMYLKLNTINNKQHYQKIEKANRVIGAQK